jgi:hypothetical protein
LVVIPGGGGGCLPFSYKALPSSFYFGLVERVDVDLFLYVEIEGEHGSIGGEVMSRDLAGGQWEGLGCREGLRLVSISRGPLAMVMARMFVFVFVPVRRSRPGGA